MNADTVKGLPLGELKVVALACCIGEYTDNEGIEHAEWDMEVLPGCAELWAKFPDPPRRAIRCSCCGHALKHACALTHLETGNGYWIGRECAHKITSLQRYLGLLQQKSVAQAERLACDQRERDYLAAHPQAQGVIARAKASKIKLVLDMLANLRRYGELSDKQLEVMARIMEEDARRRASATGTAPRGRQTVVGTVLSTKEVLNQFKHYSSDPDTTTKMTVDLGNGVHVHGTRPGKTALNRGDEIRFSATFEPSQNDPLFGYFSRPSHLAVLKAAPAAPAPAAPDDLPAACQPTAQPSAV
jgi:hypothetical protein